MSQVSSLVVLVWTADENAAHDLTLALSTGCGCAVETVTGSPSELRARMAAGRHDLVLLDGLGRWSQVTMLAPVLAVHDTVALLRPSEAAPYPDATVKCLPRDDLFVAERARRFRTQLNLLAAAGRDRKRASRRGAPSLASADGQLRGELESLTEKAFDLMLFLGSSGSPQLLRRLLESIDVLRVPLVIGVHHSPGFAASFRTWLERTAGRPVGWFGDRPWSELRPGIYAVSAERNGGADIGPNLDAVAVEAASGGARVLACLGSGMGTEGVDGLRVVQEKGGCAVALRPDVCSQPGMPQRAIAAGVVETLLGLDEFLTLISRVQRRAREAGSELRAVGH